jgi:hypothetical protein
VTLKAAQHVCLESQLRTQRRRCLCCTRQGGLQEGAVLTSEIETGHTAVTEVAHVHVAGLLDDIDDRHSAALCELLRSLNGAGAFRIRSRLRLKVLNGDLAFHIRVRQFIGNCADVNERRRQSAALNFRAAGRYGRSKDNILRALPECGIAQDLHFPGAGPPHRSVGSRCILLYLYVSEASLFELCRCPFNRRFRCGEAGDPAPYLVALRVTLLREIHDGHDVAANPFATQLLVLFLARGHTRGGHRQLRHVHDGTMRVAQPGRRCQPEPWRRRRFGIATRGDNEHAKQRNARTKARGCGHSGSLNKLFLRLHATGYRKKAHARILLGVHTLSAVATQQDRSFSGCSL